MYAAVYTYWVIYLINTCTGDFHFLWECLRVIFAIFWGSPSLPGSLCNLREVIRRSQVDKSVKVFNVGDEFLVHAFRSHLMTGVIHQLHIHTSTDEIPHEKSSRWLTDTAETLVSSLLMPTSTTDQIHQFYRSFLHMAFLYIDLRESIRWENGPQIVQHWKMWLPRFLGTGRKNYASESIHLISNLLANFPRHIAYIVTHNRTVNLRGLPGRGKPIDQLIEHYNL